MINRIKTGGTYKFEGQTCKVVRRVQGGNDQRVHVKFANGKERLVWSDEFRSNAEAVEAK